MSTNVGQPAETSDEEENYLHEEHKAEQRKAYEKRLSDFRKLANKIREHFLQNRTREETFLLLYKKTPQPSLDEVAELFKRVQDHYPYEGVDGKARELIIKIKQEFSKLETGIYKWPNIKIENKWFTFTEDSRYAILLGMAKKELYMHLIDFYSGEKRVLEIDGNVPKFRKPGLQLYFITHNLCLLTDCHWERDGFSMHLLRLDLQNGGKCTFISRHYCDFPLWSIIFDANDRRRFVIYSMNNYVEFALLYMAKVENDSVIHVNSKGIQMERQIYFPQLDGNKLRVLLINFTNSFEEKFKVRKEEYGQFTLVPGQPEPDFVKICDVEIEGEPRGGCFDRWFGNLGVMCGNIYINGRITFHMLDLEKRRMISNPVEFYGYVQDIILDNGVLSLCIFDYNDENLTVQRQVFNQPDSLRSMTYLKLKREAIFHGSRQFNKIASSLPPALRPLADYPMLRDQFSDPDQPSTSKSSK